MLKNIRKIITAERVNMGDIFLEQALPVENIQQIDPFLLIHHWKNEFPGNQNQKDLGVGPHPHRGFSPVTLIFKGAVHHRDSRGNDEVISAGGTQWMNSGMGIVHSERPSYELAELGGAFEIIQFWVNSPAKYKMKVPDYQSLSKDETPKIVLANGKAIIGIIAGKYAGKESKIKIVTPLQILRLELKKGATIDLEIPKQFNSLIYQLDGEMLINNEFRTIQKQMIRLDHNGTMLHLKALTDTTAISLSGKPLDEEVAASGPFVMNTDIEIMEAMRDYRMGKMGLLIEEFKS